MKRSIIILSSSIVIAITIGVLAFIYGGNNLSNISSTSAGENPAAVAVPFTNLAHGVSSKVSTRTNYLITSKSELEKLWEIIDASGKTPSVDFSKNYVAAVFAGKKPTSGYDVVVSKVEDTNVRTVTVTLINPGDNCSEKSSFTAPYALIELPITQLSFTHEDKTATNDCSR